MKKILFVTLAALVGLFGSVLPAAANAPNPPTLDWRTPTNVNVCPAGKVVINITHGVTHDADSKLMSFESAGLSRDSVRSNFGDRRDGQR